MLAIPALRTGLWNFRTFGAVSGPHPLSTTPCRPRSFVFLLRCWRQAAALGESGAFLPSHQCGGVWKLGAVGHSAWCIEAVLRREGHRKSTPCLGGMTVERKPESGPQISRISQIVSGWGKWPSENDFSHGWNMDEGGDCRLLSAKICVHQWTACRLG